ncbi:TPA: glycosyltransferase family 4 protein [Citrobacter gillenii]
MVIINFIFPEHENLPEVDHYIDYFSTLGIACYSNEKSIPKVMGKRITYIEWHIMGTHFYNKPRFLNKMEGEGLLIHEYASLSTGTYEIIKKIKDFIKSKLGHRPDYQIFLNEYIKSKMSIDGIPNELRDMGVSKIFINNRNQYVGAKITNYDFAYVGSMAPERKIEIFLDSMIMKDKKILLIGKPADYLVRRYSQNKNIIFIGKVEQNKIPEILSQAKVCVNYVPDVYPYNRQTSTKLIEYLSLGKDVVSNKYEWVLGFIRVNDLKYDIINDEFIYIHNDQKYIAPEWSSIISRLKITTKLINNENFKKYNAF